MVLWGMKPLLRAPPNALALALGCAALFLEASIADAHPIAPHVFCETYPNAPTCLAGMPSCTYCHDGSPPTRNAFGRALESLILPGAMRPLPDPDFMQALPAALHGVEQLDVDMDGYVDLDEITAGTLPADAASFPDKGTCPTKTKNSNWDVCNYDPAYVFKKLRLDFCGTSPGYDELVAFKARAEGDQRAALDTELDACLKTRFWTGKNGQLWQLANRKIRPLQAIKANEDAGQIPLADYYDDYNLFTWSQSQDHDARTALTADFFVTRTEMGPDAPPVYATADSSSMYERIERPRRAGMLTSGWNLVYNVMFTALPRTAAAQAYRAFLGKDIAHLEGLNPIDGEPKDYDGRGVTQDACKICHATLDPLSYPFKNYNGLTQPAGEYDPNRIQNNFADLAPNITEMPEPGYVLGQPVANLTEWAQVAANSNEFASATVMDYWKLLLGRTPRPSEQSEFDKLWTDFKDASKHNYRVERMLHDFIKTEAYGVP
jgi:hypothetical protein